MYQAKLTMGKSGTSLVVQWLKIHLPVQGTRVQSQSGKVPHAVEQ